VLLYLHADTTLPADALTRALAVLDNPAVIAGAYRTWHVADPGHVPWVAPLLHLAETQTSSNHRRSMQSKIP